MKTGSIETSLVGTSGSPGVVAVAYESADFPTQLPGVLNESLKRMPRSPDSSEKPLLQLLLVVATSSVDASRE